MATKSEAVVENARVQNAESLRQWIGLLTGLMLVFLAAAMYGIGRAYREGLLYQFGLNVGQAPEEFYGYLYWGYAAGAPLLLLWLAVAALGLFALAGLSYAIRWLAQKSKWVQARIEWWDRFPQIGPPSAHQKYSAYGILTIAFGYLVFVTYLILDQAQDFGVKRGERVIEALDTSYESDAPSDMQWIELTWYGEGSKRTLHGYRLLCTQDLCSIYNPAPDGLGLMVVPLDERPEMRILKKPRATRSKSSPAGDGNTSQDGSSHSQG